MVLGELGALLTSETLPDTLPMVAGANCTLKVLDCPAARVSGRVRPVMLKPVPETVACETLTVDRKSTRLNSSHGSISYAVFCLKKKRRQGPEPAERTGTQTESTRS